jgi:glucose-1-phosphate cytidylyltransferase
MFANGEGAFWFRFHSWRYWSDTMKVVLFCGGFGLRMQEASPSIPKPMVPVGNRPILLHIMKYYAHYGHTDFILCLGQRAEVIKDYFLHYNEALTNDFIISDGGKQVELLSSDIHKWRIAFINTGLQSMIGERLKRVQAHLTDEQFFLATYGDALTDAPLPTLLADFLQRDKVAGFLCVRPASYSFHTVTIAEDNVVRRIEDVTKSDLWINGGFFVFRSDIFDYIREGEDLITEPFARLIEQEQVVAYRYEGFWAPMDTLKDKHNLEALVERGRPPWEVWEQDGDEKSDQGAFL